MCRLQRTIYVWSGCFGNSFTQLCMVNCRYSCNSEEWERRNDISTRKSGNSYAAHRIELVYFGPTFVAHAVSHTSSEPILRSDDWSI